jgi:hypothetical protein
MSRTEWVEVNDRITCSVLNGHLLHTEAHSDGRADLYFNRTHRGTRCTLRHAQRMLTHLGTHSEPVNGPTIMEWADALRTQNVTLMQRVIDALTNTPACTPTATFRHMSTRTFGCEFEFSACTANQYGLANELTNVGIQCINENYNHTTRNHWKIVPDGTVSWGELVSPILQDEAGIQTMRTALQTAQRQNTRANRSCGFHVHFGAQDLDLQQLKNIALGWLDVQGAVNVMLPNSRRHSNHSYCLDNSATPMTRTRITNAMTIDQLVTAAGTQGRYRKLNFMALDAHGTLEFRAHPGTSNADVAEDWVRFLDAFIEAALDPGNVFPVSPSRADISHLETLLNHLRLPIATRDRLLARGRRFEAAANR